MDMSIKETRLTAEVVLGWMTIIATGALVSTRRIRARSNDGTLTGLAEA